MKDERFSPPEWLTASFIEQRLQNHSRNDELIIIEMKIEPATNPGDHYGSQMFRLNLSLQKNKAADEEELTILAKCLPKGEFSEKLAESNVFLREIKMFTKTLPALYDMLSKVFPGQEKLCADCYGAEEDFKTTVILFEDLKKSHFTLADRFSGLDSEHANLVLTTLAKFHASSLIYIEQDPDALRYYDQYMWSYEEDKNGIADALYAKAISSIADELEKRKDLPNRDRYYKKLRDLEKTIVDNVFSNYARDDSKLNVILHGDTWINNMMFKYDGDQVKSIRFLDFQISNYNSPAIDLNYFIFMSCRARFSDIDSLLAIYHDAFMETLNRLNYKLKKPFTLDTLKKDFYEKLSFGMATFLCIYPITVLKPEQAPELADMLADKKNDASQNLFGNQHFLDRLSIALPFFEKHGVF